MAGVLGLGLLFHAAAPHGAAAATSYAWRSAVDGSADDPARWIPSGVPTSTDYVNAIYAGTYTITFPAGVSNTYVHSYAGGAVTLQFSAPHTTTGFTVRPNTAGSTARIASGVLNTDYFEIDGANAAADFTLTGRTTALHSIAHVHSTGTGDLVGVQGTTVFNVSGGARLYSGDATSSTWGIKIATTTGSTATMTVAGYDLLTLAKSHLYMVGLADLTVGAAGTGRLNIMNGGQADAARNVYLTRDPGSVGFLTVGSTNGLPSSASTLNVSGDLGVGRQFFAVETGRAEMTVLDDGLVRVAGRCEIGSPAGDHGCFLRLQQGATLIGTGGFQLWPTAGLGLDLRGGLMHLRGGAFTWPDSRALVVSSNVGTPVLWIANGVANTGPYVSGAATGLFVGRGGTGTLHVGQPGTVFTMGNGTTSIGDSLGANGTFLVDSSAAVVSSGDVLVGNRGLGVLDVRAGGSMNVRRIQVGAQVNSNGSVLVHGPGATLGAVDYVWIGGSNLDPGGSGFFEVDSGGVASLVPSGGAPALTTVYANGALWAARQGRFEVSGNLVCFGQILLSDGEVAGTILTVASNGHVDGAGRLASAVQNAGRVNPFEGTTPIGTIRVSNAFSQNSTGHLWVSLGPGPGPRNDSLIVDGAATLAGTLDIGTIPDFVSTPGDTFTVLTCLSRTGVFDVVTWNGAPLSGQAVVLYGPNSVKIVIPNGNTAVGPGAGIGPVTAIRFAALTSATSLAFELDLPEAAGVEVTLFDLAGRQVTRIADGTLPAGRRRLTAAPSGDGIASGIYFARAIVRSNGTTTVRTVRAVRLR